MKRTCKKVIEGNDILKKLPGVPKNNDFSYYTPTDSTLV